MKINLLHIIGFFVGFILTMFLAFIMQGCTTTKYVPVIEQRDSVVYVGHYDTLIVHIKDSAERYVSNDTIYLTKWKTRLETKITHDTINIGTNKEIPVIQEVETIKETVPDWCWWLLAICGAFVLYKVGRFALKVYTQGRV